MWFEEPERALADPLQFLAHVMVFGMLKDLRALRGIVRTDDYRWVLQYAPSGIFDPQSWTYWNLVYGRPVPARDQELLNRSAEDVITSARNRLRRGQ
jgi:hypothetical protein